MDSNNHCRICIAETGTIKIFYDTDNVHAISTRIMNCALVKVFLNDGLPDVICKECLQNLNIAFTFKQKCEESDVTLRKMITCNNKENDCTLKYKEEINNHEDSDSEGCDGRLEDLSSVEDTSKADCNDANGVVDCDKVNSADVGEQGLQVDPLEQTLSSENSLKGKKILKGVRLKRSRKKQTEVPVGNADELNGSEKGQLFICEVCSKAYSSRRQLRRHQVTHGERKRHTCSVCGKQFHYKGNLQVHERIHTGERPFLCNSCGKSFAQVSGLQRHLTIHMDDKPFSCSVCGKRFKLADTLACHVRTHTAERPYKCSAASCDKAFTHHSALNKHMTVHTGERKHSCAHCSKCFSRSDSLAQHLKIHTGERPYACPTCSAAFSSKSTLRIHLRTHTAEKPYACQYCHKAFAQSSVLTRHLRTHTGQRPYQCAQCHVTFSLKVRLVEHMRTCTPPNPINNDYTKQEHPTPPSVPMLPLDNNIQPQQFPTNHHPIQDHGFTNQILLPHNTLINVDNLQVNPNLHLAPTPSSLGQEDHLRYMHLMKNNHTYYRHHTHQL